MTYRPIDCSLHDRMEAAAVRRHPVRVRWTDDSGSHERSTRVADVRTDRGAEYLVLADGSSVRLDRIVSFEVDERDDPR